MELDSTLLSTQYYMVRIKSSRAIPGIAQRPPLHHSVVAIEKGALYFYMYKSAELYFKEIFS